MTKSSLILRTLFVALAAFFSATSFANDFDIVGAMSGYSRLSSGQEPQPISIFDRVKDPDCQKLWAIPHAIESYSTFFPSKNKNKSSSIKPELDHLDKVEQEVLNPIFVKEVREHSDEVHRCLQAVYKRAIAEVDHPNDNYVGKATPQMESDIRAVTEQVTKLEYPLSSGNVGRFAPPSILSGTTANH